MIQKMVFGLLLVGLCNACVSKKIYNDLENELTNLKKENREVQDLNAALNKDKTALQTDLEAQKNNLQFVTAERDKLILDIAALKSKMAILQDSYKALEKNSNESLQANMNKNRELLAQLDAKEKALATEQDRLNKSAKRVQEMEDLIAAKEASMRKLKETLSKALNGFEGKGLTVEQKNGKVYVSMENKLLFNSGSWAVGAEGKKAVVALGKVLADNPEIAVLIEGHTDNDPFGGTGVIADNWDLSTKRATAIVAILGENKAINKESLTAAGRGEFSPLVSNATADGKAKNRRIEIILTPKLDKIAEMLQDIN